MRGWIAGATLNFVNWNFVVYSSAWYRFISYERCRYKMARQNKEGYTVHTKGILNPLWYTIPLMHGTLSDLVNLLSLCTVIQFRIICATSVPYPSKYMADGLMNKGPPAQAAAGLSCQLVPGAHAPPQLT